MNISNHDLRILESMAMKKEQERANKELAYQVQQRWEADRLAKAKVNTHRYPLIKSSPINQHLHSLNGVSMRLSHFCHKTKITKRAVFGPPIRIISGPPLKYGNSSIDHKKNHDSSIMTFIMY